MRRLILHCMAKEGEGPHTTYVCGWDVCLHSVCLAPHSADQNHQKNRSTFCICCPLQKVGRSLDSRTVPHCFPVPLGPKLSGSEQQQDKVFSLRKILADSAKETTPFLHPLLTPPRIGRGCSSSPHKSRIHCSPSKPQDHKKSRELPNRIVSLAVVPLQPLAGMVAGPYGPMEKAREYC